MLNFGTFELILAIIAIALVLIPVTLLLLFLWVSSRKKDR